MRPGGGCRATGRRARTARSTAKPTSRSASMSPLAVNTSARIETEKITMLDSVARNASLSAHAVRQVDRVGRRADAEQRAERAADEAGDRRPGPAHHPDRLALPQRVDAVGDQEQRRFPRSSPAAAAPPAASRPATAPASDSGTIHLSSDQSASREKRTPSASAADTSSSTHIGSTKSSGRKCDRIGTVNSAAPKAEMPKIDVGAERPPPRR